MSLSNKATALFGAASIALITAYDNTTQAETAPPPASTETHFVTFVPVNGCTQDSYELRALLAPTLDIKSPLPLTPEQIEILFKTVNTIKEDLYRRFEKTTSRMTIEDYTAPALEYERTGKMPTTTAIDGFLHEDLPAITAVFYKKAQEALGSEIKITQGHINFSGGLNASIGPVPECKSI